MEGDTQSHYQHRLPRCLWSAHQFNIEVDQKSRIHVRNLLAASSAQDYRLCTDFETECVAAVRKRTLWSSKQKRSKSVSFHDRLECESYERSSTDVFKHTESHVIQMCEFQSLSQWCCRSFPQPLEHVWTTVELDVHFTHPIWGLHNCKTVLIV